MQYISEALNILSEDNYDNRKSREKVKDKFIDQYILQYKQDFPFKRGTLHHLNDTRYFDGEIVDSVDAIKSEDLQDSIFICSKNNSVDLEDLAHKIIAFCNRNGVKSMQDLSNLLENNVEIFSQEIQDNDSIMKMNFSNALNSRFATFKFKAED